MAITQYSHIKLLAAKSCELLWSKFLLSNFAQLEVWSKMRNIRWGIVLFLVQYCLLSGCVLYFDIKKNEDSFADDSVNFINEIGTNINQSIRSGALLLLQHKRIENTSHQLIDYFCKGMEKAQELSKFKGIIGLNYCFKNSDHQPQAGVSNTDFGILLMPKSYKSYIIDVSEEYSLNMERAIAKVAAQQGLKKYIYKVLHPGNLVLVIGLCHEHNIISLIYRNIYTLFAILIFMGCLYAAYKYSSNRHDKRLQALINENNSLQAHQAYTASLRNHYFLLFNSLRKISSILTGAKDNSGNITIFPKQEIQLLNDINLIANRLMLPLTHDQAQPHDLKKVISETESLLSTYIKDKNINFEVSYETENTEIENSRDHLKILLSNILYRTFNIAASKSTIKLRVFENPCDNGTIIIHLHDTSYESIFLNQDINQALFSEYDTQEEFFKFATSLEIELSHVYAQYRGNNTIFSIKKYLEFNIQNLANEGYAKNVYQINS